MAETPSTPFDASKSRIPWPDSVGQNLIDQYRDFARQKRPVYWAIGEIVDKEGEELNELMFMKERQESERIGRDLRESPEGDQIWSQLEGWRELEAITEWARMLEETDGNIERHPEYIENMGQPLAGARIGGHSTTDKAAESYLRNQRILQASRKDPLGKEIIKMKSEELEIRARNVGQDPEKDGRVLGFRQAAKRYNQILNYLIGNEVVAA